MIKGFVGTSLVDYPGKISSVVFYSGCNYQCPYCQNVSLVDPQLTDNLPEISETVVLKKIMERIRFIDGVVLTGGEPTLYEDSLMRILGEIKENPLCRDLSIKLDTNGSSPLLLKSLIDKKYLNYVAMDLKTSPTLYDSISGMKQSYQKVSQSIDILKASSLDYEFRITIVPTLVDEEILVSLGEKINDSKRFVLQQFRPKITLDPSFEKVVPYPNSEIKRLAEVLRNRFSFEVIERV